MKQAGVHHTLLTLAWHAKLPPTTTPAWHAKLPLLLTAPCQVEQWRPRQVNATTTPLLLLFAIYSHHSTATATSATLLLGMCHRQPVQPSLLLCLSEATLAGLHLLLVAMPPTTATATATYQVSGSGMGTVSGAVAVKNSAFAAASCCR